MVRIKYSSHEVLTSSAEAVPHLSSQLMSTSLTHSVHAGEIETENKTQKEQEVRPPAKSLAADLKSPGIMNSQVGDTDVGSPLVVSGKDPLVRRSKRRRTTPPHLVLEDKSQQLIQNHRRNHDKPAVVYIDNSESESEDVSESESEPDTFADSDDLSPNHHPTPEAGSNLDSTSTTSNNDDDDASGCEPLKIRIKLDAVTKKGQPSNPTRSSKPASVQPKRALGRPPKPKPTTPLPPPQPVSDSSVPKKGRGRPRMVRDDGDTQLSQPAIKRPQGRPRKIRELQDADSSQPNPKPKRRGRPPTVHVLDPEERDIQPQRPTKPSHKRRQDTSPKASSTSPPLKKPDTALGKKARGRPKAIPSSQGISKLAWEYEVLKVPYPQGDEPVTKWDSYCVYCLDGGLLVCCDSCPRVFHKRCLQTNGIAIPEEDTAAKWHCRDCVDFSHADSCVVTGNHTSDDKRLLTCATCPRSFHWAAIKGSQSGVSVAMGDEHETITCNPSSGEWVCSRCTSSSADSQKKAPPKSQRGSKFEATVLTKVTKLLEQLPVTHWGSVVGSRIHSTMLMTNAAEVMLESEEGDGTDGTLQMQSDVQSMQRRLSFLLAWGGGVGRPRETALFKQLKQNNHGDNGSVEHFQRCFHECGFAVGDTQHGLPTETAERLYTEVMAVHTRTAYTIRTLDLTDVLEDTGFRTFKARGVNRYDMTIAHFDNYPELNNDAPWLPLVKAILGDDIKRLSTSCILSLPGSDGQKWHSDGEHMHSGFVLPPHCINVFVPLIDMTTELGPTEFVPASHIDFSKTKGMQAPCCVAGQPLFFDHRTKHRGVPNRSTFARPLMYITYAKSWFVEYNNVGLVKTNNKKAQYADLPELLVMPKSRSDRYHTQ